MDRGGCRADRRQRQHGGHDPVGHAGDGAGVGQGDPRRGADRRCRRQRARGREPLHVPRSGQQHPQCNPPQDALGSRGSGGRPRHLRRRNRRGRRLQQPRNGSQPRQRMGGAARLGVERRGLPHDAQHQRRPRRPHPHEQLARQHRGCGKPGDLQPDGGGRRHVHVEQPGQPGARVDGQQRGGARAAGNGQGLRRRQRVAARSERGHRRRRKPRPHGRRTPQARRRDARLQHHLRDRQHGLWRPALARFSDRLCDELGDSGRRGHQRAHPAVLHRRVVPVRHGPPPKRDHAHRRAAQGDAAQRHHRHGGRSRLSERDRGLGHGAAQQHALLSRLAPPIARLGRPQRRRPRHRRVPGVHDRGGVLDRAAQGHTGVDRRAGNVGSRESGGQQPRPHGHGTRLDHVSRKRLRRGTIHRRRRSRHPQQRRAGARQRAGGGHVDDPGRRNRGQRRRPRPGIRGRGHGAGIGAGHPGSGRGESRRDLSGQRVPREPRRLQHGVRRSAGERDRVLEPAVLGAGAFLRLSGQDRHERLLPLRGGIQSDGPRPADGDAERVQQRSRDAGSRGVARTGAEPRRTSA